MKKTSTLQHQVKTPRYDLPLHKDESTGFLIVLVALMAFLSAIVLAFAFGLNHMVDRWSAGLSETVTVELPVQGIDGSVRSADTLSALQASVRPQLEALEGVVTADSVSPDTVRGRIQSWLGTSPFVAELPVPALLSVTLDRAGKTRAGKNGLQGNLSDLTRAIQQIEPTLKLHSHAPWMDDMAKLVGLIQFALLLLVGVIFVTTIAAIAGGMKAQIESHQADLELLHFMGAHDGYITQQFMGHAGVLSLTGAAIGTLTAAVIVAIVDAIFQASAGGVMPAFHWSLGFGAALIGLPLCLSMISSISARYTVLDVLEKMP